MPNIDLSILNQRQTPAFYADILANRPAAGFVGRIFVSTNTFAFFRDNGTSWDLIGGPGTGTVTGSGAAGQVSFWNSANTITGSNNLFWDNVNGHLGIGTVTPGTALGINHNQNNIIQLNQTTATNDSKIAFQNSGTPLWRIGNSYNTGANDFAIFDVVGSIQPVTVKKTTGEVLIGTTTTGTGKLVVASTTSDNGVQIVGATAPSLRIDNAISGQTKRIGIGLATAVNNFIQNSQNLDMCIFNGSTSAAGNMLFGIYDTALANVQEAARISAARNFLVGGITDTGQKLQVSGTAIITGAASFSSTITTTQLNAYGASNANLIIAGVTTGTNNPRLFIKADESLNTVYAFSGSSTGSDNLSIGVGGGTNIYIKAGGSVGINTTSPGYTATNRQVVAINGGSGAGEGAILAFMQAGVNKGYVFSIQNDMEFWCETGEMRIGNASSNKIEFRTNNIPRLTIKATGIINMSNVPNSSVGLLSGDIYQTAGVLNIVP
jgi:hypothetical protein